MSGAMLLSNRKLSLESEQEEFSPKVLPLTLPRVALMGRRNVGKSTLINALCGYRRVITDPQPGLTRDIVEVKVEREGARFLLSDLPGLDVEQPDVLEAKGLQRAHDYIAAADMVLVLFAAPALGSYDLELIHWIRRRADFPPILYLVNKVDVPESAATVLAEFYQAGISPLPISARGRWNLKYLLQQMTEREPRLLAASHESIPPQPSVISHESIPPQPSATSHESTAPQPSTAPPLSVAARTATPTAMPTVAQAATPTAMPTAAQAATPTAMPTAAQTAMPTVTQTAMPTAASTAISTAIPIAIVGSPNAGKSSLFNCILQREVSLVSEVPNTTRDSLDTVVHWRSTALKCIDTAGLRRLGLQTKGARALPGVDFYSMARTKRAIKEARVVIQVIDLLRGPTDLDKKIAALIKREGCAVVVALNKCDLVKEEAKGNLRQRLQFLFPHLEKRPLVFCSARTGRGIRSLLDNCLELDRRMNIHIPAAELNKRLREWERQLAGGARRLKIGHVTQATGQPPTFVFFLHNRREFPAGATAYLENCIRKQYGLDGIPLRIFARYGRKK